MSLPPDQARWARELVRIPPYSSTTQRAWEAATKKRRLQIEESDPVCVRPDMKEGGFRLTGGRGLAAEEEKQRWHARATGPAALGFHFV